MIRKLFASIRRDRQVWLSPDRFTHYLFYSSSGLRCLGTKQITTFPVYQRNETSRPLFSVVAQLLKDILRRCPVRIQYTRTDSAVDCENIDQQIVNCYAQAKCSRQSLLATKETSGYKFGHKSATMCCPSAYVPYSLFCAIHKKFVLRMEGSTA